MVNYECRTEVHSSISPTSRYERVSSKSFMSLRHRSYQRD